MEREHRLHWVQRVNYSASSHRRIRGRKRRKGLEGVEGEEEGYDEDERKSHIAAVNEAKMLILCILHHLHHYVI